MGAIVPRLFSADNTAPNVANYDLDTLAKLKGYAPEEVKKYFPAIKDWSKYDLTQVVFEPKNMSPQDLQNGFYKAIESFHNYNNLLQRQFKTMKLGFNTSIGTFFQNIYELGVYKKILNQK